MITRVLVQGNYGSFWGLTEEQEEYVRDRGLDPEVTTWRSNRHHPVYLEMFDRFKEGTRLYGKGHQSHFWASQPGYLEVQEIHGDTYTITEYDGKETAKTPEDFVWITV